MKKNTIVRLSAILAGSLLTATLAWAAADYSAMSTEELAAKRGSLQQSTSEERSAFQNEWQNRVRQMSPDEKQKFMGQPENAPPDGAGRKAGLGSGPGLGSGGSGAGGARGGMGGMGSGSGMGRGGMGGGRR